jgi:hypothetical protein
MKVDVLQSVIDGLKTAVPVSMDLVTKPSNMRVTGNPYRNAVKVVTISGMIGMDYEAGVNNQLGREDKDLDFSAQRPVWMRHLGRNLGTNKAGNRTYVPIKVQSASKPVYLCDGLDVTDKVTPFLRKATTPKTQDKLATKVVWRTPALDSIHKVRMLGAEYTVEV